MGEIAEIYLFSPARILMDNIQQIADAVRKGLKLIVRASMQQGRTKLTRYIVIRFTLC